MSFQRIDIRVGPRSTILTAIEHGKTEEDAITQVEYIYVGDKTDEEIISTILSGMGVTGDEIADGVYVHRDKVSQPELDD